MHRIPDWFIYRIVDGVQFLTALPLNDAPRHEPVYTTASSWAFLLWHSDAGWVERLDSARLYFAFSDLAARSPRWPSPHALLECLRPRQSPGLPDAHARPAVHLPIERRRPLRAAAAAVLLN